MLFFKNVLFLREKQKTPGLHHTEDRVGDAPKPQFPLKSVENKQKSNNQPPAPIRAPIPESAQCGSSLAF